MKAPMAPSAEAAVRACVALYVLAGLAGLLRFPDAGPVVDGVIAAFALALVPSASARIAVPLLALCLVAASLAGPADPARLPADLALVAVLGLVRPRHRVGLAATPPAPAIAVRRVTIDRPENPRRLRPEPPRPPRRTLAIGPYAPRTRVEGNVVLAFDRAALQEDNLFRDDFAG